MWWYVPITPRFNSDQNESMFAVWTFPVGRFPGTYPPNYNEGTHLITGRGPTRLAVVPN
jgi:hypothetical protein